MVVRDGEVDGIGACSRIGVGWVGLGRRPTVIATNPDLSEQIRGELSTRLDRHIDKATYEECRNRLSWHDNGPLLLVAHLRGEDELLTKLVCEYRLRRAPIPIA